MTDDGAMTGNALDYRVRCEVDDVHRIRLVFGNVQQRLCLVQRHLVRLAFHRNTAVSTGATVGFGDDGVVAVQDGGAVPLMQIGSIFTTSISRSRRLDT